MRDLRGLISAAVVFAAAFLIWNVLGSALSALLLLFTAVLVSAGLQPLVDRMSKRMPFGAAVGAAFGAVFVAVFLIGFVLVQPVGADLAKLVSAAPGYAHALQAQIASTQQYFESDQTAQKVAGAVANGAGGALTAVGQYVLGGPAFIATAIGDTLLIVLLAVGWMLSAGELKRFVLGLMPPSAHAQWGRAFAEIGARLSAYVQGVALNGTIVGVVMGAALAMVGTPYAILLGFVAAVFQAIPMVGAVISGPIILLVVLATSGWTKMWIALTIFAVIQIIDQNVLSPIIFGKRVQLSFLLIILSTVIGGTLLGIAGAFLAVPAAAVLQVLVVRIAAPAIRASHGTPPAQAAP